MSAPALQIQGIRQSFGRLRVLEHIDLTVADGERHAVIGPNGAGKSTLMNILSGTLKPSGGAVLLRGRNLTGKTPRAFTRAGVGRAFQIINVFPSLTVTENVESAVAQQQGWTWHVWRRLSRLAPVARRTEEILALVGLAERRDVPAGLLAYGEQRRLEMALCLGVEPSVLLLDEPCAGLNAEDSAAATAMLRRVSEGRTLVMVEHDMDVVFKLADRVTVLHQGRVLVTGTPAEVRASAEVQAAYLGAHA